MNFSIYLFIICVTLLVHTYFLYPIIINGLAALFKKKYKIDELYQPYVSILISAYNEEKVIVQTIRNLFYSDYPSNKIEILVGSDCSTDNTNTLLREEKKDIPSLKLYEFSLRRGKKSVLNDLAKEAKGDILVFCDSNSRYARNALNQLMKYYTDSRVGGVSGRLKFYSKQNIQSGHQEKKYWDYETKIKIAEGKLGTLIGSNGGIYSIRKELFVQMPEKEPVVDDLFLSLKVLEQKKDFLYSNDAEAEEKLTTSVKEEYERKVRILPRNLETLKKTKSLLCSPRLLVSFCFWSHKIIRWFSPILLIILLISNLLIVQIDYFFFIFLYIQVLFYLGGIIGFILSNFNIKIFPFEILYYFLMTNYAMIVGYEKFIFRKHKATWEPTVRN